MIQPSFVNGIIAQYRLAESVTADVRPSITGRFERFQCFPDAGSESKDE
jgi:hypothetical protein